MFLMMPRSVFTESNVWGVIYEAWPLLSPDIGGGCRRPSRRPCEQDVGICEAQGYVNIYLTVSGPVINTWGNSGKLDKRCISRSITDIYRPVAWWWWWWGASTGP